MRNNKLSINYTKTKFMLFSTKKTKKCPNINIGNHELEQVNQLKYLGIVFDKLSWKPHIQHMCLKLSSGFWALLKLRDYFNLKILITAHYITLWGTASAKTMGPLNKILKRILFWISQVEWWHSLLTEFINLFNLLS